MGRESTLPGWKIDPLNYTISDIADKVVEFMYNEMYSQVSPSEAQFIGFIVAGYSSGERLAELWEIGLEDVTKTPRPVGDWGKTEYRWRVQTQPSAVARLFNGSAPGLLEAVKAVVPWATHQAVQDLFVNEASAAVLPAMPFADAIAFTKGAADDMGLSLGL